MGVLVGVGGAPWHFRSVDAVPGAESVATPVPAPPAGAVGRAEVGGLSFHLVPDGIGWAVAERPSVTAGWEDEAFVVRDGVAELTRLQPAGGEPPPPELGAGVAGWWWCPSAQAVLHVSAHDGGLWLQRGQRPPEPLVAVGSSAGRVVLAAPWGLVELDLAGDEGRVVVHRAEGLRLQRIGQPSRPR
jgi:hypothetical protein